ncbi:MAG TPA: DUF805 domain-containing protein [Acinetobacter towneri]|nr:DUF805 domain-containing protein [Acinetobacter towneri]
MKGRILDFSIQTNSGLISGEDEKRYTFFGSEWKENSTPQRGVQVDFDLNEAGQAIGVYKALAQQAAPVNFNIEDKEENQYQFFDWFIKCIKNYVNFSGRARRKEYWFFRLTIFLLTMAILLVESVLGSDGIFLGLFLLATFLPDLSVSVRRLHDVGRSGWWLLMLFIPIIGAILLLIWFVTEGQKNENLYGSSPK